MSLYGYVRVSSVEQAAEDKTSLDEQRRKCEAAAMMRGEALAEVYGDPGVSGSVPLGRRPAGRAMLARLEAGDVVVAAKMDRIFRSASDALTTLDLLKSRGVGLILCDVGSDPVTENGIGRLFFTMFAAFAEFERMRIAERMSDGRAAKREKGGLVGAVPYGFRKVGEGSASTVAIDASERAVMQRIVDLKDEGLGWRKIGRTLFDEGLRTRGGGEWHPEQVRRMHAAARVLVGIDA